MHTDSEQLNRTNFRSLLQALARPGSIQPLTPLYGSVTMAAASLLLYPEVSYFAEAEGDWTLIRALTGAQEIGAEQADYLFFDTPSLQGLQRARTGDMRSPEDGATLLLRCPRLQDGLEVVLRGPGIDGQWQGCLPVSPEFLTLRDERNSSFPVGLDLFFLSDEHEVLGLPRTTAVEIL